MEALFAFGLLLAVSQAAQTSNSLVQGRSPLPPVGFDRISGQARCEHLQADTSSLVLFLTPLPFLFCEQRFATLSPEK